MRCHDLILEVATKKLNLRIEKKAMWLMTVNSKEVPTCDMTRGMELHIGQWKNKETIDVIPLDGYDFVVGLGFLERIKALVVPFADCICILDTCGRCVVPMKCDPRHNRKMLFAKQISKATKKGEATFLATLKVEDPNGKGSNIPMEIALVLNSFKDVMPPKLLKKLSSRREMDHRIELVLDA